MPTRSADLVGRDAELQELCSRLGIVASRPGGDPSADHDPAADAVLLAGDAGVGKTRLLTELRDRAVAAGWLVVAGHCLDLHDSHLPYLPFSEILGRLVAERPDVTEELLDRQPVLRRLQPGRRVRTSEDNRDESPLERADLFEAVHALLDAAAEQAPLLVVVEDAHWADQSSRDLLSFLFTRPFTSKVALVVSYRSDDLHRRHPLRRQVAEWSRLRVDRLQLGPLDAPAVRRLVKVLHPDPIPERDIEDIVTRSEGNAFFVEELVGAAWVTGGVPADLAGTLLVRLDRLDEAAQRVVRTASAAGRRVSHALLAAASGLSDADLDQALRTAVEMHVLEPSGGDAYAFRHALLGEAVYDDLLPGERVRLHATYARVIQSTDGLGSSAELARHARLGQDLPTALLASVEAGADAMGVGGPEEASQHYEQALELLAAPGVQEATGLDATDLAIRAADAMTSAGHAQRANALLRERIERLPADAPAVERGLLLSQLALGLYVFDLPGDPVSMAAEAVDLLADASEVQQARALGHYARILAGNRREQEAREVGTAALAISQRRDLPRLRADILTTLAGLQKHHLDDNVRDALAEVIGQARATGAVAAEMRGLYTLGRFHQDRGEFDEAIALFDTCHARGVQVGSPWAPYSFDSRVMSSSVRFSLGRWDETLAQVSVAGQAPSQEAAALLRAIEGLVAAGRGRPDAVTLLADLRSAWPVDGLVAVLASGAELELAEQRGDASAALESYDRAVEVVGAIWRELFQARLRLATLALGVLGTAARRQSAAERVASGATAARLLEDGRCVIAHNRESGLVFGPETHSWIVRLEAEHLRWRWLAQVDPPDLDELVASWRGTEEKFRAYGHVHELARVRGRLAEVLRGAGDLEDARVAGDAARETAHELGATPLLDELRALGSAPGRTDPSGAGAETLTPREREILALVAEGRSNGEIGKQLFIATKTVSVHVSNILGKLGAASRTEAAALARRRGLLG